MTSTLEAVEALTELGLSEYEARCFVALTQLSQGTAKEISRVADVPQSRVYDVTEQLHRRGLVDLQESEPRKYFALPVERARDRLEGAYDDRLDTATRHLERLESRDAGDDGAWAIAGGEDIVIRTVMHVEEAEEEVYLLVSAAELLEEEVLDALGAAAASGVDVRVEVPDRAARERVHDAAPGAGVATTDLPLSPPADERREPGRLLMVDRETVLVSALQEGLVPEETEETGLWGNEVGHGLVAWVRPLLADRLDRLAFETA